ncbi:hypothetical protein [Bradyrhizobium guangdongense]|uniref:Uncharacterized protein n=1 Tax=Bradyrhizobium guangdongense TaxID=1325090 RepID=A0A410V607_9BRAD|nr:hypothetical protein [Bradyrhizobium guangdongense]QAU39070.1 hypothetical protein X265_16395 [Bradyrhizobium guangdongense]QOZ60128.1 hypothetical protein XH86_16400 [Bradyrhizobium guangdongense]GGI23700.1 hypothetical protein GCM10010987_25710 [Bradyrhizobium guangdongense]
MDALAGSLLDSLAPPRAQHAQPSRWVRIPGERKIRWNDQGNPEFLWCQRCETWLEAAWSDILDALPVAARGLAMIASYIPIYGTALSFAINTSVSLAEGESVNQSLIDGIGGALPGQPESGMVYKAGVAIARGERVGDVFIDSLNLDSSVTATLKVADQVLYGLATGENVTNVAYQAIHQVLPPEAQQGMDYARRFITGEDVRQMILSQAEQVVADGVKDKARDILERSKDQGAEALSAAHAEVNSIYNQYAAEFGYQMAFDRLPGDARAWIQLGLTGGGALKGAEQLVGTFGSVPETNTAENDILETDGLKLIASGIKYENELVSDILKQSKFTIVIDFYDSLNGVWTKRAMTYGITDPWRRGFSIAIGACEGSSERGPGQLAVYQTLAEAGERGGFDAGQAVQFNRTIEAHLRALKATKVQTTSSVSKAGPIKRNP